MKLKNFLSNILPCAFILLCLFTVNLFSQTSVTDKNDSLAAYAAENERPKNLLRPTESEVLDFEKQAFALVNQKRAENALPPLEWSDEVAKLARLHSENMVRFGFFSHKGADGKMVDDRADSLGLTRWTMIGENIAYNRGYKNPIETAVEKWLLSPMHRQNILNDRWKEAAVGIAVTADGTYYFTQVFLKRR